jgi:hypothetical protein
LARGDLAGDKVILGPVGIGHSEKPIAYGYLPIECNLRHPAQIEVAAKIRGTLEKGLYMTQNLKARS